MFSGIKQDNPGIGEAIAFLFACFGFGLFAGFGIAALILAFA